MALISKKLRGWTKLGHFQRHVMVNLVIGIVLALLLHYLHATPLISRAEDLAMDWMISMYRNTGPDDAMRVPFLFIDIDEYSYRAWGEPLVTPRDKLARLLDYAIEGRPALVLLDVDLSRRTENDQALLEILLRYREKGPVNSALPPIILARTFRRPDPGSHDQLIEERQSFLDGIVSASPKLHWASTLFELESDRVIRRWRLFEPSCNGARGNVIPAIQLLASAITIDEVHGSERLGKAIAPFLPESCEDGNRTLATPPIDKHDSFELGRLHVSLRQDRLSSRILYTIPWQPNTILSVGKGAFVDGRNVPLLVRLPAVKITDNKSEELDSGLLKGRVVVIGGSFDDSRDHYLTPLGEMPGALVVINSINSLLGSGEVEAPSLWIKLIVEALLIVMMSYLFAKFPSFWGLLVSGTVVILALLPISFLVFRYGLWLDFAIPLLAVQLHSMSAQLEESIKHPRS
ncbi:MAG: CHASE2 domain-containing protein [Candidatus Thiodiazotropha sp.]